ncbi:MAG TPA: YbhB/YbcL family Raf kinase inhibitor-like protein [Polyangiaceae bacterium]
MTLPRTFAPLVLTLAPLLLAHCVTEPPPDGDDSATGGTGNPTGGAAGAAGNPLGGSGGAPSGGVSTGGTPSGGTSTGGTPTGGSGGSAGTGGSSGSSGAGVAGSSAGMGGAGAGGTGGASGASPLGGKSGGGAGGTGGTTGAAGGSGGGGAFVLTSSKIVPDSEMSADFTCAGDGHSPPLAWSGVPAGTMSFAMVFVDTTIIDANMMDQRGYHSAIWDMPASTMSLPEDVPDGATITSPVMARQFNPLRAGYLGPCPNNGAAPADTYEFRLYALPVATLTGQLTSVRSILQAIMAANPLGVAVLRAKSDATGTLR